MRWIALPLALVTVTLLAESAVAVDIPADVVVHREPCPGHAEPTACAIEGNVWILPVSGPEVLWHEIGHAVENRLLDSHPGARAWFIAAFGYPAGTPWWSGWQERSPGELFAEAYGRCHLNWRPRSSSIRVKHRGGMRVSVEVRRGGVAGYAYDPTPRQHRRICNAIAVLELLHPPAKRGASPAVP